MGALLLASCGGQSRTTPPPAANSVNAVTARSGLPGPEDFLAEFVFGLFADPVHNFIMDQVGLSENTAAQLQELSNKIDALSAQLQDTESRLSSQINQLGLSNRLDYLQDKRTSLDALYGRFKDVVPVAVELKETQQKDPSNQTKINDLMDELKSRKQKFVAKADEIGVEELSKNFHDRLQPQSGPGVLRQYGTFIMDKHRILTNADSQAVDNMYTLLEEEQALATWMSIEAELAQYPYTNPRTKAFVDNAIANFSHWRADQRDPKAENGLLPDIPPVVAIDRGPDTNVTLYSTRNKDMFTYVGGGSVTAIRYAPDKYAYAPWGEALNSQVWPKPSPPLWRSTVPPTVQAAARQVNNTKFGEATFTNWTVPSDAQLGGLFSGLPSAKTNASISAYITSIFGKVMVPPNSWIWTNDGIDLAFFPDQETVKKVFSHKGRSTDDYSIALHPPIVGYSAQGICHDCVSREINPDLDPIYRSQLGVLLPVRTTGSDEDHVSTPG